MTDPNIVTDRDIEQLSEEAGARLARAAAHIDATELADGRWAHYAAETSSWHVVSAAELEELCDYLDSDDATVAGDAYSHWCAGTSATEMPRRWHPETTERR